MSARKLDHWVTGALVFYSLVVVAALVVTGAQFAGVRAPSGWSATSAALFTGSANLTYDDGFYYLRIAQQIASGAGSTFDGVNPTNGYHPLWLLCLVPIFWLTSAADVALLVALGVQGAVMAIGVGLTYRVARLDLGRSGAILAALLWVHAQLPYRTALSGMEYGLHAVSTVAVIYLYRRRFVGASPRPRVYLALGALLALTFLARLDTILLAGCIGAALGLRELRGSFRSAGIRRMIALSLPVAGVLLLYVSANLRLFGHALPVSGVIKRDWAARVLAQDPEYQAHGWLVAKLSALLWPFGHMKHAYVFFLVAGSVGVAGLWVVAVVVRARVESGGRQTTLPVPVNWFAQAPLLWGSLVLFSVLQPTFFLLVYHDGYTFQRWYYVIQPWLASLLIAAVAEALRRFVQRWSHSFAWARHVPSLLSILLFCGVPLASARTVRQWHQEALLGPSREPLYAAAQWVKANVPSGAVVGAWNAGAVSYLSGKRVINLDGRVNSWDFYRTGQYDLCLYWREAGVTYLVDTFQIDHEVHFINRFYAPDVDLSSCASDLDRVWIGPAYHGTSQNAVAFRLR